MEMGRFVTNSVYVLPMYESHMNIVFQYLIPK